MLAATVKRILEARVYDVALETPVSEAPQLSERLGCRVLIKREDLQPVYSFKLRGAYNRMARLSGAERKRGVIAASAGNHAQGVALAAARLDIASTIVMPRTTPEIKVASVRAQGSRVVLHGDSFDEALAHALGEVSKRGMVFIHPYDDPDIIAGQGTIAMEILRQHSGPLDAVFIPVGGGGLIAGMTAYIKYLRPGVKVIGVEAHDSACLKAALAAGRRVTLPQVGIFADGVAVSQVGKLPFQLVRDYVDDVITATTDEMCAAVKDLFEDTRSIAEPSGALAVAGMKKYAERKRWKNRTLLAVHSGANVNFDRLRHISERTELGEGREVILAVTVPEKPGSFRQFTRALSGRSITEFNYRFSDAASAHIFVGIQTLEGKRKQLLRELREQGYKVVDMTDNEMAKVHIRHMVGGRASAGDERLFRFIFPERPGALIQFLEAIGGRWNISLFHYRNHGSAYGRVLAGLQVPKGDDAALQRFLDTVDYEYWEETDNPAFKIFL